MIKSQEVKCLFGFHTRKYHKISMVEALQLRPLDGAQVTLIKYCVYCNATEVEIYSQKYLMTHFKDLSIELQEVIVDLMKRGSVVCPKNLISNI